MNRNRQRHSSTWETKSAPHRNTGALLFMSCSHCDISSIEQVQTRSNKLKQSYEEKNAEYQVQIVRVVCCVFFVLVCLTQQTGIGWMLHVDGTRLHVALFLACSMT